MAVLTIQREQQRIMLLESQAVEDGSTELSFSSEYPVDRGYYTEILDHSGKGANLERANRGACPLLLNHDQSQLIGIVDMAWIDRPAKKGRARVRFAPTEAGQEAKTLMDGGFLQNVSFRYAISKHREEHEEGKPPTIVVIGWELLEISLVSVPADPTVGVGRSVPPAYQATITAAIQPGAAMENTSTATLTPEQGGSTGLSASEERARIKLITGMGARYAEKLPGGKARADQLVEHAIEGGLDEQATRSLFADEILGAGQRAQSVSRPAPALDLSPKEQKNYSLFRALKVAAALRRPEISIKDCGLELECSRAIAEHIGADPQGLFVPVNDLVINGRDALRGQMLVEGQGQGQRNYVVGTANLGGNTVEAMLDSTRMVDFLFNAPRCREAGITMLMGLQGNVDIPTEDGSAMALTWLAEDAPTVVTNGTFGILQMRPRTIGANMRVTQRMLLQSELSMEAYMRSRLQTILAIGIDTAVIRGTGTGGQPTGILNTAGINSVALGTNGGAPTWGSLVDMETALGDFNMDQLGDSPRWMNNARTRGVLRKTLRNAVSGADYIWEQAGIGGDGSLLGYQALTTNQLPNNLTKGTGTNLSAIILGYWNTVFLGQWGIVDILANPFSDADFLRGAIRIRIMSTLDILLSRPRAFSVITDMITT